MKFLLTLLIAMHLDLWPTVLAALGLDSVPNRGTSLFASELPAGRVAAQFLGPIRSSKHTSPSPTDVGVP